MENAELIGLSRQSALRRQMDVIANNLANISTKGFKAERTLFSEYLMPVAEASTFQRGDHTLSYVWDRGTMTDFSMGPTTLTDAPLDVTISEDAFFVIATDQGEKYTKNGSFQLDNEGMLVTSEGHAVLGEGGPIRFSADDVDIFFALDGTVSSNNGTKGKLMAVEFDSPQMLTRAGSSMFDGENANQVQARFTHGALENSNVRGVVEVTEMIEVTRAYESLANMMKRMDDMRRSAIQKLGSLTA
ncbi:MAG: flagellar basal-body rod protein FlgF [Rhizobiales bacterium]|nr:flagellar basal-body rod protein FlgF [Hyphomicrobiales bacterium]